MWVFEVSTGEVRRSHKDGSYTLEDRAYSGVLGARNDPRQQSVQNVGPIPKGAYIITEPYDSATHGPFVLRLLAQKGTELYGRDGFLIHGDNNSHTASHGCIILPRVTRELIHASNDVLLVVI